MSLTKGVLNPGERNDDEMFIGWSNAPAIDRRFLLAAMPLGLGLSGAAAYAVASNLGDPGPGSWNTGVSHAITGYLTAAPYPMIRVPDKQAPFGMRTYLVLAEQKCTSALKLGAVSARPVSAKGVLIQRRERRALEVPLFLDEWLSDADLPAAPAIALPKAQSFGTATLQGAIMDSKCFFGVMRPARGRTHKGCASLCIRGGIPPSFWARTKDGREAVMLMTDSQGGPLAEEILPLVADPVQAEGEIVRVGDMLQFRADGAAYRRLT